MIEINKMSDLQYYANFETFDYQEKTIVLYDDHRCILTALFEAYKLGLTNADTNVISFDRHDDALPLLPDTQKALANLLEEGINSITSRVFKDFVEFDIREYDDDWVSVGMELGLIKNIVNIGNEDCHNILSWKNNEYVDSNKNVHYGFVLNHLRDELNSHGGILGDRFLGHDNLKLRQIFNYNLPGETDGFSEVESNYVLDFDLDCFTTHCVNQLYAWPEAIFAKEYGLGYETSYFMRQLIRRAKFITICKEPSFCGGVGESNKILGYLDKYFFDGVLRTKSIQ